MINLNKEIIHSIRTITALSALIFMACDNTFAATSIDQDVLELKKTKTFSLGLVGFVGHISDAEKTYRRVLQDPMALSIFSRLIADQDATVESRIYAACGLRTLSKEAFITHTQKLRIPDKASVLRGDVLKMENVSDLLGRIKKFGCS